MLWATRLLAYATREGPVPVLSFGPAATNIAAQVRTALTVADERVPSLLVGLPAGTRNVANARGAFAKTVTATKSGTGGILNLGLARLGSPLPVRDGITFSVLEGENVTAQAALERLVELHQADTRRFREPERAALLLRLLGWGW